MLQSTAPCGLTLHNTLSAIIHLLPQSLHQPSPTLTSQMLTNTTASIARHWSVLYVYSVLHTPHVNKTSSLSNIMSLAKTYTHTHRMYNECCSAVLHWPTGGIQLSILTATMWWRSYVPCIERKGQASHSSCALLTTSYSRKGFIVLHTYICIIRK